MNPKLIAPSLVCALAWFCLGNSALAEDSASTPVPNAAVQAKAAACAACHGLDGNSVNPEWPSLAGQNAQYMAKQVRLFKSNARPNATMTPIAQALSEQDIDDIASFFSTQTLHGLEADKSKVAIGQRLYRGGNAATKVPACLACHGPDGHGNLPANYPALHGQRSAYIASQLNAYKTGQRTTDVNKIMRDIAANLSPDEIVAVSSYIQGIR